MNVYVRQNNNNLLKYLTESEIASLEFHSEKVELSPNEFISLDKGTVSVVERGIVNLVSPKNETIPAYLLWDAMATYAINKKWDMQFNVSNLTNEEYVAGCDWGTCYYGESRRMTATVNYNW